MKSKGNNKCFKHKKEGHYVKNYPDRKGKEKKNKTFNSGDIVVVKENLDTIDVLSITVNNSGDEWILYLGCFYHMSPNRD